MSGRVGKHHRRSSIFRTLVPSRAGKLPPRGIPAGCWFNGRLMRAPRDGYPGVGRSRPDADGVGQPSLLSHAGCPVVAVQAVYPSISAWHAAPAAEERYGQSSDVLKGCASSTFELGARRHQERASATRGCRSASLGEDTRSDLPRPRRRSVELSFSSGPSMSAA